METFTCQADPSGASHQSFLKRFAISLPRASVSQCVASFHGRILTAGEGDSLSSRPNANQLSPPPRLPSLAPPKPQTLMSAVITETLARSKCRPAVAAFPSRGAETKQRQAVIKPVTILRQAGPEFDTQSGL